MIAPPKSPYRILVAAALRRRLDMRGVELYSTLMVGAKIAASRASPAVQRDSQAMNLGPDTA